MKWTKEVITNYMKDNQVYICVKEESKEGRTRQQEKTWYKIFNAIAIHESSKWETVNSQEVKMYMLWWCFWTHKLKLSKTEIELPNKSQTSKLTKEDWIFFIDALLLYCKVKKVPVKIESAEIQSLYDSYN